MFSGIIICVGTVQSVIRKGKQYRITLSLSKKSDRATLSRGMSVSVDGICFTIADLVQTGCILDVTLETARVTTVDGWNKGTRVNIEFPIRADTLLSGHLVLGHVDGVGAVVDVYTHGNGKRLVFAPPNDLLRFLPYKGSVTVNGVSLTIANVDAEQGQCIVALVPHTLTHTNLRALKKGDRVNIEVDALARYLDHLLAERLRTFEERLIKMHDHEN